MSTHQEPIVIATDFGTGLAEFFSSRNFSSVFVLADDNTLVHCYPKIQKFLPEHDIIQIKPGEEYKGLKTCELIWHELTTAKADRKSVLVNLGGGVIGDMGGFAAGCYKRGIGFVNIPTSLLAMVDASVGGKTGIDFGGYKNQLGLFNEPEQVFVYPGFLETLPFRELQSGFAEIIKHYLIADAPAFDELYKENKPLAEFDWPPTIEKSIAIKSTIVAQDPLEHGARKALNFGHTIGHAVESLFMEKGEGRLLHGEAVAIGVLAEGFISKKLTGLQNDELEKMAAAIGKYYTLPVVPPNDFGKVLDYISQDKKNAGGGNNFTLLKSIGNYCINNNVEEGLITDSLKYYNSLQA